MPREHLATGEELAVRERGVFQADNSTRGGSEALSSGGAGLAERERKASEQRLGKPRRKARSGQRGRGSQTTQALVALIY